MKLIIETDLGRDPDDYFALLYFASAGADIKAICVSPGDPDQIAVARFVCEKLKLSCPIGAGKINRKKSSCSGFHTQLLKKHGFPLEAEADGAVSPANGVISYVGKPTYVGKMPARQDIARNRPNQ